MAVEPARRLRRIQAPVAVAVQQRERLVDRQVVHSA